MKLHVANSRREAIRLSLAAAEVCWVAPAFLAFSRTGDLHRSLLLWLGLLGFYLGYSYVYRAVAAARLRLWLQQGLPVVALLLSFVLFLRFHLYANVQFEGVEWLLQPFLGLADEMAALPSEWVVFMVLVYLWARGINLARRSLSVESVGFSFRFGIVILMGVALAIGGFMGEDVSEFIVPYFFFALVAVALARVEEVSLLPNSGRVGFGGFWIGSTVGAVALLILLGVAVAIFFYGGGLRQVLRWLSPLWLVVQIIVVAVGVLLLALVQLVLSLFSIDLASLGEALREAMQRLGQLADVGQLFPPSAADTSARPPFLGILQAVMIVGIPLAVVLIVVLITWNRVHRERRKERDETHESLLTASALAASLRAMLGAGRDRLGELAGLVDRFGLGARFLSAISIRRIYANLVRLGAEAGYPRAETQTPYEYLQTLYEAFPDSDDDVLVITHAYVNAHYGQVPDTREELQAIRDCWERVRARAAERQKRKAK